MEHFLTNNLLLERAKRLAQKASLPGEISDALNIVVFLINNEHYAIEAQKIKAIQPYQGATFIPGLPNLFIGVTNFSGVLYAIIDFRQIFALPTNTQNTNKYLIFIEHPHLKVCFLIDKISDFRIISKKEIQTQLTGIKGAQKGCIKGILPDATILIDEQAILKEHIEDFNQVKGV